MAKSEEYPLVTIVGPTASGKTALGLFLAERLNGEIVNFDSVQVYRGFDIGSGKVPAYEPIGAGRWRIACTLLFLTRNARHPDQASPSTGALYYSSVPRPGHRAVAAVNGSVKDSAGR